jgi:hypothetical protein
MGKEGKFEGSDSRRLAVWVMDTVCFDTELPGAVFYFKKAKLQITGRPTRGVVQFTRKTVL